MSTLDRDELAKDLGAEVRARASNPLEGYTRGAELTFLSALPRELRPTFAHDDARELLRDTRRVAREHVRPRADQLHDLRHPPAGDRDRDAIALGR